MHQPQGIVLNTLHIRVTSIVQFCFSLWRVSRINFQVLYLYDNQIDAIEGLEFATNLQYLSLQNNFIKEIPDLQLQDLAKLHLEDNEISYVAGLDSCLKLEELHISSQRIPTFTSLNFDPNTLDCLARSLLVLDISGNGISTLVSFHVLSNLRKLLCTHNSIVDIAELEAIVRLRYLTEASFTANPCANHRKYRDTVIAASSDSLRVLDEVPVLRHQQIAIRGLVEHRKKLGTFAGGHPFMEMDGVSGDMSGAYDLDGAEMEGFEGQGL